MALKLDTRKYLETKYEELAKQVDMLGGKPKLGTILVGDRADSAIYVKNKEKALEKGHMESETFSLADGVPVDAIATLIKQLNENKDINGILLQLPLNREFYSKTDEDYLINLINPLKDVDGLTMINQGKLFNNYNPDTYLQPCTPSGIIDFLDALDKFDLSFKARALVFGRSNLLGKPLAQMLMAKGFTVTTIHSKSNLTPDQAIELYKPHHIFLCTGQKNLISAMDLMKHSIKTQNTCGTNNYSLIETIVDAGISRDEKGIRGDFRKEDYDLLDERDEFYKVGYTPVPNGVGPLTTYSLAANTLKAYILQKEIK